MTREVMAAIGVVSVVMLVASMVLTPAILAKLPADYFQREKPHLLTRFRQAGALECFVLLGKNVLGLVAIAAGIAMLVLPGQGILTIIIGMVLVDFPGKAAVERRFVAAPKVLRAVNWLRGKAKKPPLVL